MWIVDGRVQWLGPNLAQQLGRKNAPEGFGCRAPPRARSQFPGRSPPTAGLAGATGERAISPAFYLCFLCVYQIRQNEPGPFSLQGRLGMCVCLWTNPMGVWTVIIRDKRAPANGTVRGYWSHGATAPCGAMPFLSTPQPKYIYFLVSRLGLGV